MTKADFIDVFKEKATLDTKKRAGEYVETFLQIVEETLVKGEGIQFVGWGSFDVKDTAAKLGRNPKTGEEIKIPPKKAVKFKAGKNLTEKVNK